MTYNFGPFNFAIFISITGNSGPAVDVNPGALTFSLTKGSTTVVTQSLVISNSATPAQNFTVTASTSSGSNWLSVSPGSGTVAPFGTSSVSVHVDPSGLGVGTYLGTLSVSATPERATIRNRGTGDRRGRRTPTSNFTIRAALSDRGHRQLTFSAIHFDSERRGGLAEFHGLHVHDVRRIRVADRITLLRHGYIGKRRTGVSEHPCHEPAAGRLLRPGANCCRWRLELAADGFGGGQRRRSGRGHRRVRLSDRVDLRGPGRRNRSSIADRFGDESFHNHADLQRGNYVRPNYAVFHRAARQRARGFHALGYANRSTYYQRAGGGCLRGQHPTAFCAG